MLRSLLYKIGIIRNITLIGEQVDGKTNLYHHLYTHNNIPNIGDYISLNVNNEDMIFIVSTKSYTYDKRNTCWLLVTPIK